MKATVVNFPAGVRGFFVDSKLVVSDRRITVNEGFLAGVSEKIHVYNGDLTSEN